MIDGGGVVGGNCGEVALAEGAAGGEEGEGEEGHAAEEEFEVGALEGVRLLLTAAVMVLSGFVLGWLLVLLDWCSEVFARRFGFRLGAPGEEREEHGFNSLVVVVGT